MIVAGVDYSLTCPAMCVFDTGDDNDRIGHFNFSDCNFYFLTQSRKYDVQFKNIRGKFFDHEGMTDVLRYDGISNFFIDRLLETDKQCHVFLEGYSMGSKGRVFNIAENAGILKYRLWLFGVECTEIPPTVLKKYATGKGNANKWNPSSDLIDAYWLCKYGVDSLTSETK